MHPVIWLGMGVAACGLLIWIRARFASFAAQRPADYATTLPKIDIRRHLSGPILCEGIVYGPLGRVASRFVADMQGDWQGDTGTLREHFRYDSGKTQDRCWHLTLGADGHILAKADDLVGAGQGWQSGAALLLRYRIQLPADAGGHVLDATDWIYVLENGTLMNRSEFRKFGIKVGALVATMRPMNT